MKDPADTSAPVAAFTSLPPNTVVSSPAAVRATVADANLDYWRLVIAVSWWARLMMANLRRDREKFAARLSA